MNYDNAVERPKVLLEKLEKIQKDILQDIEILSRNHSVYTKGLKGNIDLIKENCLAIKEDIRENVDKLICCNTEMHKKLMEKCVGLMEEYSRITAKLDSVINLNTKKVDLILLLVKYSRRLSIFFNSTCGSRMCFDCCNFNINCLI